MKRKASWRVKPSALLMRLCIVLLFIVLLSVSTLWSVQSALPNDTTQITNHDLMSVAEGNGGTITGTRMIPISALGPTLTPTPTSGPLFLPLVLKQPTPTPTPTPTPPPMTNGDFESGQFSGWTAGGELPQSVTDRDKQGGNFAALLGNPDWGVAFPNEIPAGSAYMEQVINLPSEGVSRLTFWYRMISHDVLIGGAGRLFDSFDVTINGIKGDRIYRTGNPDPSGQGSPPWDSGWMQATLDLSRYRGQTVTLRFGVWNREYPPVNGLDVYNTWVYVDDVSILLPPPTATPTPTLTPTPTATPIPTQTPTPTATPNPFEENDTSETAFGPLISGQVYEAYPDDQDDWYYFVISQTSSAEVVVTDYASLGQLVVYREVVDGQSIVIANDGRGLSTMRVPNEINPNAMTNLSPGKYFVRIFTVDNYSTDQLYRLQVQYE